MLRRHSSYIFSILLVFPLVNPSGRQRARELFDKVHSSQPCETKSRVGLVESRSQGADGRNLARTIKRSLNLLLSELSYLRQHRGI